jgi:hypothetical protein
MGRFRNAHGEQHVGCCPTSKAVPVQFRTDTILAVRDYATNLQPQIKWAARFCFAEAGRFSNSPDLASQSRQDHRINGFPARLSSTSIVPGLDLLEVPISAFIGTFGIGAKYEDVPFAENLGCATC